MLGKVQNGLKHCIKAFRRTDDGSMSVEAVMVMPLVLSGLMLSYGWFSAFEAKARANKAAYTISDYVTRQTEAITPEFIEGLGDIYRFLNHENNVSLRVSSVRWSTADNDNGEYKLIWSSATGNYAALEAADVVDIEHRLPILTDGGEVVVVETERPWAAPFNVGLGEIAFTDFVTTTPRFASQVTYDDGTGGAQQTDTEDQEVEEEWDGRYSSGGSRRGSHHR
ncbi:TadE/TadG family type IV pilus assembly protein [Celeribacter marinus]|uniref:TadE/TadG family type IV pilus assembly protein n=1 Tax=Celeribacter marinus TaxID=1397108 RepID=UPI003F6CB3B9